MKRTLLLLAGLLISTAAMAQRDPLTPGQVTMDPANGKGPSIELVTQYQLAMTHDELPEHMFRRSQGYICEKDGQQYMVTREDIGMWRKTRFDQGPPHKRDGRSHTATLYCFDAYMNCEALAAGSQDGDIIVGILSDYDPCQVNPMFQHQPGPNASVLRWGVGAYRQGADGSWEPLLFDGKPMCALNVLKGCNTLNIFEQRNREPYLWEQGDLSDPTGPNKDEVFGYIGGSLSRNSVRGRNHLEDPSKWWSGELAYGGKTIRRWGMGRMDEAWDLVKAEQAKSPADTVWLNILVRPQTTTTTLNEKQVGWLQTVVERISEFIPTATKIIASPMPEFFPEACFVVNQGAIETSKAMVAWGVNNGLWVEGPTLKGIDETTWNGPRDPCHQGPEGEEMHGKQLLEGIG